MKTTDEEKQYEKNGDTCDCAYIHRRSAGAVLGRVKNFSWYPLPGNRAMKEDVLVE